ncbi:hypothetical protein DENSPDRAFT_831810 [Dentipellis sp. KUC8613]|nr:hypothetical protein DENSPDRAFT_831810 [Dentipellis sp. KUC8613]
MRTDAAAGPLGIVRTTAYLPHLASTPNTQEAGSSSESSSFSPYGRQDKISHVHASSSSSIWSNPPFPFSPVQRSTIITLARRGLI